MTEQTTKPPIELTEEQQIAVNNIVDWARDKTNKKQIKSMGGFAGTGKTTIIKSVIKGLEGASSNDEDEGVSRYGFNVAVCAFTGKAASVLRRKGVDASTMHSLMYTPRIDEKTKEVFFTKLPFLEEDLIIVDEASMVNTELNDDLVSFGKKILYVGDPGQLEPVGDNPGVMRNPELMLSKIHRQAAQSPIIQLSIKAREAQPLVMPESEELKLMDRQADPDLMLSVDQVIVAFNVARVKFNSALRAAKGFKSLLHEGEKLICLRNDSRHGVFNGQMFFVTKIHEEKYDRVICDLEDESGIRKSWMEVAKIGLGNAKFNAKVDKIPFKACHFDYGYVITCHKSQGSEWDSVLVFEQAAPPTLWSMPKWRYTAITRAAKRLIYVK